MLPLSDSVPTRRSPWVNLMLIATNVAVFVYELSLGTAFDSFVARWGVVPLRISRVIAHAPGANDTVLITLLTAAFLHASWLHIGGNMLFLWIFGDNIEDRLGHLPYLFFYLACGIGANLADVAMTPLSTVPAIGASGAIAGVLGAYLISFPGASVSVVVPILFFFTVIDLPALLLLGFWFLMQFLGGLNSAASGVTGGIAWWAHVGGFVIGIVLMILLPKSDSDRYAVRSRWSSGSRGGTVASTGVFVGLISFVGTVAELLSLAHAAVAYVGTDAIPRTLVPLADLLVRASHPLVLPLARYFPAIQLNGHVVEIYSLAAAIAYYALSAFVVWLIAGILFRGPERIQSW